MAWLPAWHSLGGCSRALPRIGALPDKPGTAELTAKPRQLGTAKSRVLLPPTFGVTEAGVAPCVPFTPCLYVRRSAHQCGVRAPC